jgi:hypothetical protein
MIPFTTNTDEIVEQRLQANACEYVGSVVIIILLVNKLAVLELVSLATLPLVVIHYSVEVFVVRAIAIKVYLSVSVVAYIIFTSGRYPSRQELY